VRTYNRDDYSQDHATADYEREARANGQREQPEPRDTSTHAQVCAALRNDLPKFHHATPVQLIRPPAEPAELPEEHDANTASRMSIAQLRDRIRGMEATTHEYNTRGGISSRTGRKEKPSERIARAAKLKAYRAELATREAREAEDEARDAAAQQPAEATAAQDRADLAQRDAERQPERLQRAAAAYVAAEGPAHQVDPADVPTLVKCRRCGLLVAQDAEGDMIGHLAIGQTVCPAKPTEWDRPRTNPNFAHRTAQPAPEPEPIHDTTSQAATIPAATVARYRREQPGREALAAALADPDHAPTTQAERIAAARAKCNADGCSSQPADDRGLCGFHRAQYDTANQARPTATAAELPPVPPAAAQAIERASSKRRLTVATAQAETLSALDKAVEQLVREHTSGAVIDAAWSAAHRIFAPKAGRA
jgi:hypothetical protein